MARAWRGRDRQFLAWGVARAWRGRGAGMSCFPMGPEAEPVPELEAGIDPKPEPKPKLEPEAEVRGDLCRPQRRTDYMTSILQKIPRSCWRLNLARGQNLEIGDTCSLETRPPRSEQN
eukprot:gene16662-biopygen9805